MSLFRPDYHWRFDRFTFLWECWLEHHPASDTVCMSRVGWVAEEVAARHDAKGLFVRQLGDLRGYTLREV